MSKQDENEKRPRINTTPHQLTNLKDRTLRERQEIAKKGAKASAEKRRQKKELKNIAKLILDTALSQDEKDYLTAAGFKPNQVLTKGGLALVTSLRKAIKNGNIAALETIAKIAGEFDEKPVININERKVFNFVPCTKPTPKRPDETQDAGIVQEENKKSD